VTIASISDLVGAVFAGERIPPEAVEDTACYYQDIAAHLMAVHRKRGRPLVLGVCGTQASGKSTMALVLQKIMAEAGGLSVACFSLDDLYLSSARRQELAVTVHPLLRTRGVPGTHDVDLGVQLIKRLVSALPGEQTAIPVFDKATDNPRAADRWRIFTGRADVVIFEGWCVGAVPQAEAALATPVNALEADEDMTGAWRRYVQTQLAGPYQVLFGNLHLLLMIRAPGFETVFAWRRQQEHKLRDALARDPSAASTARVMSDAELRRFIAHYERLTRHILAEMPARADILLTLDEARKMSGLTFRSRI
jgi:D-glycerate 3-kinase